MRSEAELTKLFREGGKKITPQRQCIFRILQDNQTHPSAEAIFDAARLEMDSISLKTVYQTLNELVEIGEILSLDFGTGAFRFDPNNSAHHHLICTKCGQIRDLQLANLVPELPSELAQGFRVSKAEVTYRGICVRCDN